MRPRRSLKVLGDCFELVDCRPLLAVDWSNGRFETVIYVVVYEYGFGILKRTDYCMHLLRNIRAVTLLLDHRDNRLEMAFGALQAIGNRTVTLMCSITVRCCGRVA